MQKTQAQGTYVEDQPPDRMQALPTVLFPTAFPKWLDARCGRHAGGQLGQLSLQKLLELSSQLNDKGSMRLVRKQQSGICGENVVKKQTIGLYVTGTSTASRLQEGQRSLQYPVAAPVKDVSGTPSRPKTSLQPLQAFQPIRQTVSADIALLKPPTVRKDPCKPSQHSNCTAEPAQQHTCKLHRSSSRVSYPAAAESTMPARSGTASGLLAQHHKRLASASQPDASLATDQLSGRRNPLFRDAVASDLYQSYSKQQGSSACSSHNSTDAMQPSSSLQLLQSEPISVPSTLSAVLTTTVLHEHNAVELPAKQVGKEKEVLFYESNDEQTGSETSDSSSFTDAGDIGQIGGCLPDLSSSGTDCDDCISVGTSQAITDGSSSTGDADLTEATGIASKGRAGPLLLPSALGTASTVAFVGLQPTPNTDFDLVPLRCVCFSVDESLLMHACCGKSMSLRKVEQLRDWQLAQGAVAQKMARKKSASCSPSALQNCAAEGCMCMWPLDFVMHHVCCCTTRIV